jgi:hypothetical protein
MDGNFAELVDDAARGLGLNDYQLSAAIGLLEGNRVYSPKQVHRLRAGEVRHPAPHGAPARCRSPRSGSCWWSSRPTGGWS